jgi:hypothetical protein
MPVLLLPEDLLFIDLCESTKMGAVPQGGWVVEKETFMLKRWVLFGLFGEREQQLHFGRDDNSFWVQAIARGSSSS